MKSLFIILLEKKITVIMIVSSIVIVSFIFLFNIPLTLLPELKVNTITIVIKYPGQSPWRIENVITKPIEESLSLVGGIKECISSTRDDEAKIFITFEPGLDLKNKILDVRSAIDIVKNGFPRDVQEPEIFNGNNNDKPAIIISLTSDKISVNNLREYAEDILKSKFKRMDGITEVIVGGGFKKEIVIRADPENLVSRKIDYELLRKVIRLSNINMPIGKVGENKEVGIVLEGRFKNIDDIYELPVYLSNETSQILLKDIAHIDEYSEERDSISREKGKETISLYLFKASLANTIILSRNVNKLIDTIKTSDINIEVSYDEAIFIKKAILNLIMSILIGGFLAALILIIYIKSLRQSIAILITMPISVCCVIIFFSLSGISFNLISLSGFAVAVGMLVDNGIIFIEKFNDQYKANRDSALSCKLVIDEINTPILASTLTTICIFLPFLVFNTSTDIYKDLSGAFVVSLLSSYFGAMIIIPFFLKNFYINKLKIEDSKFMYKLDFIYKNSIKGLKFRNIDKLAKQLRQIITTKNSIYIPIWFILGILSIFLFSRIPNNYGELFERNEIYATLDLETGIDINRTSDLVNSIEKIIMSEKGIASVSSDIKKGHCSFIIKLGNNAEKDKIIEKIRERTVLPESASLIFEKGRDESESNNINIEIKGKDIAVIREISDSLVKNLYGNDKIKDVIYRYREGGPQYEINLNNDKIDQIGLNNMEVAEYIRNTFYGPVISKFIDKREIDIRCITGDKNKYDINILRYLPMLTKSGSITHLGELSEIIKNKSISTIWRKEKTRFEMISVTPSTRFIDKLVSEIKQTVELIKIPEDYEVEIGKNIENKNDDLKETMFLLIISISLIYIVVAVIYESLMIPIYIFFAIPTAFTGSIITLYLTGRSITIAVYLGLLVLCGIAVNNTILFIDQMLKTHGKLIKSSEDVILQIVNDRKRAINITTKTTILGLIPMLFASEGSVLGFDFAITIISGILYSKICILHIFPKFFIKND